MSTRTRSGKSAREREAADAKRYEADDFGFNKKDVAISAMDARERRAQSDAVKRTARALAQQMDPAQKDPVFFDGPLAFNIAAKVDAEGTIPDLCPYLTITDKDGNAKSIQTHANRMAKPSDFEDVGGARIKQQATKLGKTMAWYCLQTEPRRDPEDQYLFEDDDDAEDLESEALAVTALQRSLLAQVSGAEGEDTPEGKKALAAMKKMGLSSRDDAAAASLGKQNKSSTRDARKLKDIQEIIKAAKKAYGKLRGRARMPAGNASEFNAEDLFQAMKDCVAGKQGSSVVIRNLAVPVLDKSGRVEEAKFEDVPTFLPEALLPVIFEPERADMTEDQYVEKMRLYNDRYAKQLLDIYKAMMERAQKKARKEKRGALSAAQRVGLTASNAHLRRAKIAAAAAAADDAAGDAESSPDPASVGGGADEDEDDLSAILTGAMAASGSGGRRFA